MGSRHAGRPELPPWAAGMCLMEYAPQVAAALGEHCAAVSAAARLRQQLMEALPLTGLLTTQELDSITFRFFLFLSSGRASVAPCARQGACGGSSSRRCQRLPC